MNVSCYNFEFPPAMRLIFFISVGNLFRLTLSVLASFLETV